MASRTFGRVLAAFSVLAASVATQAPAVVDAAPAAWPPATSDLPLDPAAHFGRLDNGMRLLWANNPNPAARCSLRLVVHVGGLDEADDECGMAHFVEHMAFNGTRRFPGNAVKQWLRDHGMRELVHANAFTSNRDTTYCLDLPDNAAATIADGIDVLRQFADGVLFAADEVASEKAVIDAEDRERSTPAQLAHDALRVRLLAGSRSCQRDAMGVASQRATFTPARLRAFYERWYRADNMSLVLVGDLESCDVAGLCRRVFDSMAKPSASPPARAPLGTPTLTDTVFAIDEPGRTDVEFLVQHPIAQRLGEVSKATLRRDVLRNTTAEMARWMLSDRLESADSAVMHLEVRSPARSQLTDELDSMLVSFQCEPARADAALGACANAVLGLCRGGFPARLLDRVRTVQLPELQHGFERLMQGDCRAMANRYAATLADSRVPRDLQAVRDVSCAALGELTTEQCTNELHSAWACELPSIVAIGPPGSSIDAAAVWEQQVERMQQTVSAAVATDEDRGAARPPLPAPSPAPGATALPAWPYAVAAAAPAPAPTTRLHDAALDVEDLHFANGVRLLVKTTRSVPDEVLVATSIGAGAWQLAEQPRLAAYLFERMLPEAGLGKLDAGDLGALASARGASVTMSVPPGQFQLRGRTTRAALGFQLEWLCAQCADPGIDAVRVQRTVQELAARWRGMEGSVPGLTQAFLSRLVEQQVGYATGQIATVKIEHVCNFLASRWITAPITVTVVGDLDVDATIGLVSRTFGALPLRPAPLQRTDAPYCVTALGLHEQHAAANAKVSTVGVFAPLPDLAGKDRVCVTMLADILTDRLMARLREAEGATYDCRADAFEFSCAVRSCMLWISLRVAPGKEPAALLAVQSELAAACTNGITADEMAGVRRQMRNELQDHRQSNAWWIDRLAACHVDANTLRDLAALGADLEALTTEDLSKLAAQCLAPERLSSMVLAGQVGK